ncbi:MAG: hypothetical protein GY742_07285 [Hyphomicrobiales bacterium]|nr:hypothetical protein [Hyphomicrobiales bacterium]
MPDIFRYAGQFLFFAIIAVFVGYFSNQPVYRQFPDGMAQIKLGFAHGASRKVDCRKLTAKEIAKLPANQRRPNNCTRERIPLYIQLILDGKVIYDELLVATGLFNDGPGQVYKKITVPVGTHTITVRLRDTKRSSGFDYETTRQMVFEPNQNIAIDFKADAGGFLFR